MELKDSILIPAAREEVYAALNDPEVLQACIPGCEEVIQTGENEMEAKVVLKIGPVKARFSGTVQLNPIRPPEAFSLSGQGNGGAAGFAKGGAEVYLAEAEGGTQLTYDAKAEIGGKLAQLGSRLVQGTAKKLAAKFFLSLQDRLSDTSAAA